MSKAWSYTAITESTEKEIEHYRQLAANAIDYQSKLHYQTMAYGALSLWNRVTMGWQAHDDKSRLTALVEAIGAVPDADPQ